MVENSLSGGDPSPSGVPASTNDKISAGGDVGDIGNTAEGTRTETHANHQQQTGEMTNTTSSAGGSSAGGSAMEKDTRSPSNVSKAPLEP